MGPVLTAAGLMAAAPMERDVDCVAWNGKVRLARLDGATKLRLALIGDALPKAEGKLQLKDPAVLGFALDVLAASIVDETGALQFADPSARAWLSGEISAIAELLNEAMRLNRLGAAEQDEEVAEAKKD